MDWEDMACKLSRKNTRMYTVKGLDYYLGKHIVKECDYKDSMLYSEFKTLIQKLRESGDKRDESNTKEIVLLYNQICDGGKTISEKKDSKTKYEKVLSNCSRDELKGICYQIKNYIMADDFRIGAFYRFAVDENNIKSK